MSLWGAKELAYSRFGGGLVLDVDPTEIALDQASDLQNVDLRGNALDVRRGRVQLNSSAPTANKVNGAHIYYPRDGSTRSFIVQANTDIYEGTSTTLTAETLTLTGGVPYDFLSWREFVYGGSSVDAMYRRSSAGAWTALALITPPIAPPVANYSPVLESFDDDTEHASDTTAGWVYTDAANTDIALVTDDKREGTAASAFVWSTGAKGDSFTKRWSSALRVDLSYAEDFVCWYQSTKAGATFQIGIIPNQPITDYTGGGGGFTATQLNGAIANGTDTAITLDSTAGYLKNDVVRIESELLLITAVASNGTGLTVVRGYGGTSGASHADNLPVYQSVNFAAFPETKTVDTDAWTPIRISLANLPPERRTASMGLGIKFLTPGKSGFPVTVTLDQGLARGPLITATDLTSVEFEYYATFQNTSTSEESNPSPVAVVKIEDPPPTYGAKVTVAASGTSGVDVRRVWRYRRRGGFDRARLVGTMPNAATAINGSALSVNTYATSFVVDSTAGMSAGCVLTIDSEELLVRTVDSDGVTLTVSRAFNATTAATHADNAPVTTSYFVDFRSDGEIRLADPEELTEGRMLPPLATTYAIINNRMLAGGATISGTKYPWRLYLSRLNFPEQFSSIIEPDFSPTVGGYVDLPGREHILRIVEFDGSALIFCDRAIYELTGSGWSNDADGFALRKRCSVGLDARWAVVVWERLVFFLAEDGVRVLNPGGGAHEGSFDTWVVSEPVDSRLRAIPSTYRNLSAMGIDERGRLHVSIVRSGQTVPDAALVFDPYLPDAQLQQGYQPARRGWLYYTNWGFSCFVKLKRGGGDAGQLLGGDASTCKLHYLQRSSADAELTTDDGSAISWSWQSRAEDPGTGGTHAWVYVALEADGNAGGNTTLNDSGGISAADVTVTVTSGAVFAVNDYAKIDNEVVLITAISSNDLTITRAQAGTTAALHSNGATITLVRVITLTPVLDGTAGTALGLSCGTATSGFATVLRRVGASLLARYAALKVSGSHKIAVRVRAIRAGVYPRDGR